MHAQICERARVLRWTAAAQLREWNAGNGPRAEGVKTHDEAVGAGLLGVGAGSMTKGGCSAGWFDFLRPTRSLGEVYLLTGCGGANLGAWNAADLSSGYRRGRQGE